MYFVVHINDTNPVDARCVMFICHDQNLQRQCEIERQSHKKEEMHKEYKRKRYYNSEWPANINPCLLYLHRPVPLGDHRNPAPGRGSPNANRRSRPSLGYIESEEKCARGGSERWSSVLPSLLTQGTGDNYVHTYEVRSCIFGHTNELETICSINWPWL